MHTNPDPYLLWITSRTAGFATLILASLGVSLGLLMSTKRLKGRGPDLRTAHQTLALATIAALLVHALSLLGDSYLRPTVFDLTIPFASGYETFWTSLGIVAGWGLVLLGVSYYARRAIGTPRWRRLHRFTALAWIFGLAHALGEGSDAGQVWFLAMVAIVALPALALLAVRLSASSVRPRDTASRGDGRRRQIDREESGDQRPHVVNGTPDRSTGCAGHDRDAGERRHHLGSDRGWRVPLAQGDRA
jgi:sulfoxide reductase heme-binding subunit YedZ